VYGILRKLATIVGYKCVHFTRKVSLHYLVKFRTIIVTKVYTVFFGKKWVALKRAGCWVAVKRTGYCCWTWPSLQTRSSKRENK